MNSTSPRLRIGLFAGLDAGVRRAIRKAQAAKVEIEIVTDLAAVQTYYALHCQTRRRHGVPPQPFRFFASIHRHLVAAGLGRVIQARWQGRIVASAVFFQFGRHAVYKFGASDRAFQHLRPTNLLMWEAIKWHAAHGFTALHFGRTSLANEGLRRFKLGFGAREERLACFRYDFRSGGLCDDP
ncbi:MAG: GNAT family N-acetyltransferase [Verrucomicrobiota bacterium]